MKLSQTPVSYRWPPPTLGDQARGAEIDGEAVGFALFFVNYSTFEGRAGLYLEDLFVAESGRGAGIGRAIMARLARLTSRFSMATAKSDRITCTFRPSCFSPVSMPVNESAGWDMSAVVARGK